MSLIQAYGKPDLFITVTVNPRTHAIWDLAKLMCPNLFKKFKDTKVEGKSAEEIKEIRKKREEELGKGINDPSYYDSYYTFEEVDEEELNGFGDINPRNGMYLRDIPVPLVLYSYKYLSLISDAISGKRNNRIGIFGSVAAYMFRIEYTKNGIPHLHCLVTLNSIDKKNVLPSNRIVNARLNNIVGHNIDVNFQDLTKDNQTHV